MAEPRRIYVLEVCLILIAILIAAPGAQENGATKATIDKTKALDSSAD